MEAVAAGSLASRQVREQGRAPSKQRDSQRREPEPRRPARHRRAARRPAPLTHAGRPQRPSQPHRPEPWSSWPPKPPQVRPCAVHRSGSSLPRWIDGAGRFRISHGQSPAPLSRPPRSGYRNSAAPCRPTMPARAPSCRWSPRSRPRWERWLCGDGLEPCPPRQSPGPDLPSPLPSSAPRAGTEVVVVDGSDVFIVGGSPVVGWGSIVVGVSGCAGATIAAGGTATGARAAALGAARDASYGLDDAAAAVSAGLATSSARLNSSSAWRCCSWPFSATSVSYRRRTSAAAGRWTGAWLPDAAAARENPPARPPSVTAPISNFEAMCIIPLCEDDFRRLLFRSDTLDCVPEARMRCG